MVVLYILICLTSLVLVGLVLMQDSKSGLGGITGGATMNTFGGNTDKALVKATAFVATVFFGLILLCLIFNQKSKSISIMPLADSSKVETTKSEEVKKIDLDMSEPGQKTSEVVVPIPAPEAKAEDNAAAETKDAVKPAEATEVPAETTKAPEPAAESPTKDNAEKPE